MNNPRYLTKSRFSLVLDCPTKLFYTRKKEYANTMDESLPAGLHRADGEVIGYDRLSEGTEVAAYQEEIRKSMK